MKKNDLILTTAVALYSYLFYEQSAGINFTIFNILLIALLAIKNKIVLKNRNWKIAAIGSLLTSFCIGYYGNTLSVIANVISLSILASMSINDKSSVVLSLINSFYSYSSSVLLMFIDMRERKKKNLTISNSSLRKVGLIIFPLLITLLFFFMYRASNPLFDDLAAKINLDFISWNWITFTLGGLILLYGFFYHKKIKTLSDFDENASNNIEQNSNNAILIFGKQLDIKDEAFSSIVMFLLLNLLLLVVNTLDINFMFFDHNLPKGLSYSAFVHQGTGMLITSIVIAIIIILFYFRGALNFYKKNKTIKLLAYLWIIQNVFMLISTAQRNNMYIAEFGLTYKRIGVYVYLFLCVLGLATTLIKILKIKSNHYLFRINGWLFYGVLVLSCIFNWDGIITEYNIHIAKRIEKKYLLELSCTNLPKLIELQQDSTIKNREFALQKEERNLITEDYYNTNSCNKKNNYEEDLSLKIYSFLKHRSELNWKSWYYDNAKTYRDLIDLNSKKKIKELKLAEVKLNSLTALKELNNIETMDLRSNLITDINELDQFPSLKDLNLSNNKLFKLNGIEKLNRLENLDVSKNKIYDYSSLYPLQNLKKLIVGITITTFQYEALQKNLPNTIIIKG